MTLQLAIESIHAPKGISSVIAGVLSGDMSYLQDQSARDKTLAEAQSQLARVVESQNNCCSDYAFWGYEGDRSYWQSIVNILKAAQIVGPSNLPDVEAPDIANSVVMDACWKIEKFGETVLQLCGAPRT